MTHFLKDAFLGPNELLPVNDSQDNAPAPDLTALMESYDGELTESNNDGFEVIYKVGYRHESIRIHRCRVRFRWILKDRPKSHAANR